LTAFRLFALNIGTLVRPAVELFTTLVHLVTDEMFVKAADWNFRAVEIKTLDVISLTARANSARVTIGVPRLTKNPRTLVVVSAWWRVWGSC